MKITVPDINTHINNKLKALKELRSRANPKDKSNLSAYFGNFIQLCWPMMAVINPPTSETIDGFKRQVWYCNCSGKAIPEMQKYNANKEVDLNYASDELLCSVFYNNGYNKHRVYENGLAFLDIHILGMLFDYYMNSNYSSQPDLNELSIILIGLGTKDPFQIAAEMNSLKGLSDLKHINPQYEIYQVKQTFCTGSIIQKNIIPKDMVEHITPAFQDDDVIDTGGYRGLDLLVKVNGEFKPVPLGEYYPIWPLEDLKRRGYRFWLKTCMWNGTCCFDEIKFENGVSWNHHSDFFPTRVGSNFRGPGSINERDKAEMDTVINLKNGQTITVTKQGFILNNVTIPSIEGVCDVAYPFTNSDVPNALKRYAGNKSNLDIRFRAKISEFDYLVISRKDIYISDLNNEDQCSIYWN